MKVKFFKRLKNEEPFWLKRIYNAVTVIAGLASVYFAWVSIDLLESDNTQKNILEKQNDIISKLSEQNVKLDTSILELQDQNKNLSKQFLLLSNRYDFDSLAVDRSIKKDYLQLRYAYIDAFTIIYSVTVTGLENTKTIDKSLVNSLGVAVSKLESQQNNSILLSNEKLRKKWLDYQTQVVNFVGLDLKFNSIASPEAYIIKDTMLFAKDMNALYEMNLRYNEELLRYIPSKIKDARYLQMPAK